MFILSHDYFNLEFHFKLYYLQWFKKSLVFQRFFHIILTNKQWTLSVWYLWILIKNNKHLHQLYLTYWATSLTREVRVFIIYRQDKQLPQLINAALILKNYTHNIVRTTNSDWKKDGTHLEKLRRQCTQLLRILDEISSEQPWYCKSNTFQSWFITKQIYKPTDQNQFIVLFNLAFPFISASHKHQHYATDKKNKIVWRSAKRWTLKNTGHFKASSQKLYTFQVTKTWTKTHDKLTMFKQFKLASENILQTSFFLHVLCHLLPPITNVALIQNKPYRKLSSKGSLYSI